VTHARVAYTFRSSQSRYGDDGPLSAPIEVARFTVFFGLALTVDLTVVVVARVVLDDDVRWKPTGPA
jgi:hypothetical protein